jgi:putative endopeptidase
MKIHATIAAVAVLLSSACARRPEAAAPPQAPPPPGPKVVQRTLADVGLDAQAMDKTVDPCQDFYHYACGNWLKNTPIPEDKSRWSRSFNEIDKRNEEALRDILEKARQIPATDEVSAKIGAFYGACMDEEGIEKAGIKPIEPYLKIAREASTSHKALLKSLIALHDYRFPVLFDLSASQDGKDATKMIAQLDQNGLGLPDRGYYLDDDENSKKIRDFYVGHVERMLKLAGFHEKAAADAAKEIMSVETAIAKISKTKVERRAPLGMYNKIDLGGLKEKAPGFPWDEYFSALRHPDITDISVTSVPFFQGMDELLKTTKPEAWRAYLEWHVIQATAPMLPKAFVDEDFALTAQLTGQKKLEERWKRCVHATDGALGELLAQPFVRQKFGGDSKPAMETMVGQIRDAFGRNLGQLDWMDDVTRGRAGEKLKLMSFLIGYPDKWKEYNFHVDAADFAGNVLVSRAYELQRDLNKIGKPVDRGEWDMTPPTVNAYYDPQKNQMVFPAGILQLPFFSVTSATASNMGGIGMVVGHELTHGFDDEGSKFDAQGNLANWWSPGVGGKFDAKGKCIADQYSAYSPLPGVQVNGNLTLGENIADNGGVRLSFQAYRAMRENVPERISAEGFNEDQQFFLAFGQAWCTNSRDEVTRLRVKIDPHSPPMFRVNGPLSNLPEFGDAFSCRIDTPMRPSKICKVW